MNVQQKKVLNFLNELYKLTKDDYIHLRSKEFISKHRIDQKIWPIISINFVDRKKNGLKYYYKWKTIKPNLKMVDRCIRELREENDTLRLKYKINIISGDSRPRLDFINYFRLKFSDDYYNFSLDKLMREYNVALTFTEFLIHNNYILIKDTNTTTRLYKYKWNDKKSFTELKKLILEADISKGKTQIKKVETKVVEPKQENTIQIQVYENIIRTLNNDLDSKEKQIEELEKKLSLKTKRITKKVEPTQKNITILWGLIKIKY